MLNFGSTACMFRKRRRHDEQRPSAGRWPVTTTVNLLAPPPAQGLQPGRRPAFSVVVAAWMAAGTIGDAVRSVLGQTEPPAQILICDDGSPDDLAGALAPLRDHVHLIRTRHAGAGAARNAAAGMASGDFLVILDADDIWLPERLERLGDLAQARPDLDLLTTDAWFEVDGRRTGRFYDPPRAFPVYDQRTAILRRNFVMGHAAVRRSRWSQLGGFDERVPIGEDWDFWLRLLFAGGRAGCVNEPLARYRIHDNSLSGDRPASLRARVDLLDRAAARTDLTGEERSALRASRSTHLRRALLAEAEAALVADEPLARRHTIGVLTGPGMSMTARLRALAAVVLPRQAGRHLRRRRAATGSLGYERNLSQRSRGANVV
jgi:GT2 family glycosyltransferase